MSHIDRTSVHEPRNDTRKLPTPQLIDHIVTHHHTYLRKSLPFVEQLGRDVERLHGSHRKELHELVTLVTELRRVLERHLDEEEQTIFPQLTRENADPRVVADRLRAMQGDHLRVGELLARIRALADDFTMHDWACGTHTALMKELWAIERDTLHHMGLENHVLMPRFVAFDGRLSELMAGEHAWLEELLDRTIMDPQHFDFDAFEEFRAELSSQIGAEETILIPDARRRGGEPLPDARIIRVEHGALASMAASPPDPSLVSEIRDLLGSHDAREQGPNGLYETCERLAGDEASSLRERVRLAMHRSSRA